MLCLKSAFRIRIRQSSYRNHGLKIFFTECARIRNERTECLYSTCKTALCSMSYKSSSLTRWGTARITSRWIMGQAAVIENDGQSKSYFQHLVYSHKQQAQRSILLKISKKDDIPYAVATCESFGSIANVFAYAGEGDDYFLLLEFADESMAKKLLLNCQSKNAFICHSFPIYSRLIQYTRKHQSDLPKGNIVVREETKVTSIKGEEKDISNLIKHIYSMEKLSELSIRLRYFFCNLIKDSLSPLFPFCEVLPFGSSVNGIGRQGCDLDAMLKLHSYEIHHNSELHFLNKTCKDIKDLQRNAIHHVLDILRLSMPGICKVDKILTARVPILRFYFKPLKMSCDLSINNESPILMSEIIHFSGEVDSRIRPLLHAVKKWGKAVTVTHKNSPTRVTNFGLTTLVLFFLQNRPNPILPPFNEALVIKGEEMSPDFKIQYLKSTEDLRTCASLNTESLASLLKEFLMFLGTHPFKTHKLSLMTGKSTPGNNGTPVSIQYPFEESRSITQNVSEFEFIDMCEKARTSAQYLENHINQNAHFSDLRTALGLSKFSKPDSLKSNKNSMTINVGTAINQLSKDS